MKTKNTALSLLIAMFFLFAIQSCKKEPDPNKVSQTSSTSSKPKNNGSNAWISEEEISEEQIETFIETIKQEIESPTEEMVELNHAILLMQSTVNYCFSDVDSAFMEQHESIDIPISVTTSEDQISMNNIANTMYNIGNEIQDYINAEGPDDTRLISSSIEFSSDMNGYIRLFFGKTTNELSNTSPLPPTIPTTNSYLHWNRYLNPDCLMSAQQQINLLGSKYMYEMRNYELYQIRGTIDANTEPYLDGSFVIANPSSNPQDFFFSQDATGYSFGFPTTLQVNGYNPTTSGIFQITADASYQTSNGWILCLPRELVNFYIAKTLQIFDSEKPNSDCLYLYFQVAASSPSVNDYHLAHGYQFSYSKIKYRKVNPSKYM